MNYNLCQKVFKRRVFLKPRFQTKKVLFTGGWGPSAANQENASFPLDKKKSHMDSADVCLSESSQYFEKPCIFTVTIIHNNKHYREK